MRKTAALLLFVLSACTTVDFSYQDYLAKKDLRLVQTLENFQHCYDYGCKHVVGVSLSESEWARITAAFHAPQDAAEERESIARVIAGFEHVVGAKTGTKADKAGTYADITRYGHDCVDESVNTTIYLMLLDQNGLINFHDINAPTARIPVLRGRLAPHQTAVITEKGTGQRYAVDSWFHDNGHPAEIIELETWKKGWHPPKDKMSQ